MKTTDKEQKELITFTRKFFKKKKDPTTVALISVTNGESAGGFGFGDTDEIVTGIIMFAKELDEASRYSICAQLLETLPTKGMALALEEALNRKGDLSIKKGAIN